MHKRLYAFTATILTAGALLICSCGIEPVAGTETGNPDITACLESAVSLFDSVDEWMPSHYLENGERQLNPENVYTVPETVPLAKRTNTGTVSGETDTAVRYDTIFVVDTVFIRDTVVIDTMVLDTTATEGDSSVNRVVVQRLQVDSVFIADTQVFVDTFLVARTDSGTSSMDNGTSKNVRLDVTARSDSAASGAYTVVRDSVTGAVILTGGGLENTATDDPAPEITVNSSQEVQLIARNLSVNDVAIAEVYRDADGDGNINGAFAGLTSLLAYSSIRTGRGAQIDLLVDFDAGVDQSFVTDNDNRIHSLRRKSIYAKGLTETVLYGNRYLGERKDTVQLVREQETAAGSIARTVNSYFCATGHDPVDHRMNTLLLVRQSVDFRSGDLQKMSITITPDTLLEPGNIPAKGNMTAEMDFGKGRAGRIDAVADYLGGTITGIYAQAGIEYSLRYQRSDNTVELLPLE